jgi:hypothetical protein
MTAFGIAGGLPEQRFLGAKPTAWFARHEWRVSARGAAHINDPEFLELVG